MLGYYKTKVLINLHNRYSLGYFYTHLRISKLTNLLHLIKIVEYLMSNPPPVNIVPPEVQFIQAIHIDINGISRGKIFPIEKLNDLLRNKEEIVCVIGMIGTNSEMISTIKELSEHKNLSIVPDKSTFKVAPWSLDSSLGLIFVDIFDRVAKTPFPMNPRLLAKQKINELEAMGLKLVIGVENEFRIFNKTDKKIALNYKNYYSQFHEVSELYPYLKEINKDLKKCDILIESCNFESGSGQVEIPLVTSEGIEALDKSWLFKEISKHVANKMGLVASYMTCPIPLECGNGYHINHSLWTKSEKGLTNVIWEPDRVDELSEIGKYWLAGILKHSKGLTSFNCPTVNCYRRTQSALFAPDRISWNYHDRRVALRVKTSPDCEKRNYIENRCPSSACNIYLVVAGMIVAGMDGIKNKLQLPKPGNESHCEKLPTTLSEALIALKEDKVLVEGLGATFVDWYIKVKQETDINVLKSVDLNNNTEEGLSQEFMKYFDI